MDLTNIDFKDLGAYGLLLAAVAYTFFKGGPKLWTVVTAFIEQRNQLVKTTLDQLFKHADEDRKLYVEQMNGLKTVITTELQKERDFHSATLREERQMWEQLLIRRHNENGSSPAART